MTLAYFSVCEREKKNNRKKESSQSEESVVELSNLCALLKVSSSQTGETFWSEELRVNSDWLRINSFLP